MVEERKQAATPAGEDEATRLSHQARHAWDAWTAAKLHHERTDVEGLQLEPDEVVYCAVDDAGLVETPEGGAPAVTDTGSFIVTNQRCAFVGSTRTTDWAYSELVDHSVGDARATFKVSDRAEATGVSYRTEVQPQVDATIAAAIARFHGEAEHAALVDALHEDYRRAFGEWEEAGSHAPPTA